MARPRSDLKEIAILEAATTVFAAEGLSASTARIAKAAGVSNGSFFTYFTTKSDLLDRLYVALKMEMSDATAGCGPDTDARARLKCMWEAWLRWALAFPDKRRALALLSVSTEISVDARQAGEQSMVEVAVLIDACRRGGVLADAPLTFIVALMTSIAETTMAFIEASTTDTEFLTEKAFDSLWNALQ